MHRNIITNSFSLFLYFEVEYSCNIDVRVNKIYLQINLTSV